ncbi:MAG: ABC-F family ATP-binding cassette domain-containing protein [Clostridia bacterium]|nr:ABC-F family ATP-binding cassette domain-containing protein [Clostridia bacterium]
MTLLTLAGISKSFVMNRVLTDVDLTLPEYGRMGLVGVNGSGKSTLMKIIAGEEEADEGTVSLMRGVTVGFLTQHADIKTDLTVTEELSRVFDDVKRMEEKLREMEKQISEGHEELGDAYARLTARWEDAGGYEWPSRVQGVLAGLGFSQERRSQPAHLLSGGEKTRLCLARLLLRHPDLLLLDEPTNHLDLQGTEWLEETLKKYKGSVIVISHDRYFLNAVCDHMAELRQTRLTQYTGNYDEFARKREADLERQLKEYQLQQAEIERQEAIIRRYRMFNREKSIRAAESRERRLEKIERLEKPVDDKRVRFSFSSRRRTGDDVLIIKDLKKGFGGRTLFENLSLHLRAGDRVAVIGPNGVGKSTLLNIITHRLEKDEGSIQYGANLDMGYYDQQQSSLHPDKDIMSEVWDDFPHLDPDRVRGTLALFLLTGEDVFRKVSTLSGGERGRVALSKLMLRRDNLLLLDEPTNHLDMDSREVLECALQDYDGTILTVSHDRYFINRVANRVIEMTQDGVTAYEGNYDAYLEKKRQMSALLTPLETSGKTRTQIEKEQKKERASREETRAKKARLRQLESEIESTEALADELQTALGEGEIWLDHEKALAKQNELDSLKKRLEGMYAAWETLAQEVSEADA